VKRALRARRGTFEARTVAPALRSALHARRRENDARRHSRNPLPSEVRSMPRRAWTSFFLLAGALLPACGSDAADSGSGGFPSSDAGRDADTGATVTDTGVSPDTAPPPEKELESQYKAPVATGRYVWVPNPTSGRVAYVDAQTLDVRVVEAGNAPTWLAAVPGTGDATVVLNVKSSDATLLRADGGKVEAHTFKTAPYANQWALANHGKWAIAWTDARQIAYADKTQGFQDLTVIDLEAKLAPTVLTVGYRPVAVGFTSDDARAFAITQDGVAIVDLSGASPQVIRSVPISDDPLEDPGTRDVSITPDGSYALVRRDGSATITIVALDTGKRVSVVLSGPCTDLDLADSGKKAVAVVRDKAEVAILQLPGVFTDPTKLTTATLTGETVGSVSIAGTGRTALLYTNAVATQRFSILSLDDASYRTVKLYAPVLAVFPTMNAEYAVVLHDQPASSIKKGAFSVVPVGTSLPARVEGTDAKLTAVALSPQSDRAVLTERDDARKIYGAWIARMPTLATQRYALASPPIAAGMVAGARRAWIAQEHPEGRITFIDLDGGTARTLTGFELSARVVDGSQP
jgi:hypothetical protein